MTLRSAHRASSQHVPVLLEEVLEHLDLRPGDAAVDCTFGGGGYTQAILAATAPNGRVIALDRDPEAIERGGALPWVRSAEHRLTLVHGNFADVRAIANRSGFEEVRGIVADLGISSDQLLAAHRGFSFTRAGPLDMRFDPTIGESAADLIARLTEADLDHLIRMYGEDLHARRIAQAIVAERARQPITATDVLAEAIARAVRTRSRIHPATRTFQALRITVNDELESLRRGIAGMLDLLGPGGRVAIVDFHSLEDRIVKRAFRAAAVRGGGEVVTARPVRPTNAEVQANPRSRSAKLRVFQKR